MIYSNFRGPIADARAKLKTAPIVRTGFWQGLQVQNKPEMATHEVLNFSFTVGSTNVPHDELVSHTNPDLPWADDHFAERVSGEPLNPPPSEAWWPHAPGGNSAFKKEEKFSHTYPERYWPKHAGLTEDWQRGGIRFPYGDLDDLIEMMEVDPYTRQAYLPVWFPEDLGAPMTERKPCTLGYHFIMRDDRLHIVYYIRSCDFVRHLRNDIYLTTLLQHWVLNQLSSKSEGWRKVAPGSFTMHITSLHLFRNDWQRVFGND